MLFSSILDNLRRAGSIRGTRAEKVSAFVTLTRLQFKRRFLNEKNAEVSHALLDFKFVGYDYLTIEYLFNEVFVSNEYYFEAGTQQPLIVDCGANIGMSIMYFKRMYPDCKIVAFEANPHAFKLLEKNVRNNDLRNVELHNIALFDKETEISFFIGEDVGTLLGSVNQERGGGNEMRVRATRLSTYLKQYGEVDLVKMDVEGAELQILADLLESDAIGIPKEYIIEYHHNINEDKSVLASFLRKFETNGYSYNIKATFGAIDTFQDILIHFYRKDVQAVKKNYPAKPQHEVLAKAA